MNQHELKTRPRFFCRVLDGTKQFEIRTDPGGRFKPGDVLWLREHDGAEYTGRAIHKTVGHVSRWEDDVLGQFLTPGTVVMSLVPTVSAVGDRYEN